MNKLIKRNTNNVDEDEEKREGGGGGLGFEREEQGVSCIARWHVSFWISYFNQ